MLWGVRREIVGGAMGFAGKARLAETEVTHASTPKAARRDHDTIQDVLLRAIKKTISFG